MPKEKTLEDLFHDTLKEAATTSGVNDFQAMSRMPLIARRISVRSSSVLV
ncbi:MAG: hypothetical protein K0S56_1806 [Microvirga sp.]|jgi:hypothetical protein|nr:hypothetical protein [Microvirga sp.]